MWYARVTTTADASSCTRTVDAPVPFVGDVPWGSSPSEYHLCTGASAEPARSTGGCASGGRGTVLGVNALVVGAGLLLLRRRSRRGAVPRP